MDKEMSFERAYGELARIAEQLESPDISLDESISLFEEGIKLSKYCAEVLDKAKQKIERLETGEE